MPDSGDASNSPGKRGPLVRRLGAWLAVVAIVGQMLAMISLPSPAWAAEGVFPPDCHSAQPADDTGSPADHAGTPCHCPFCHLHFGARLLPPERDSMLAFAPVETIALIMEGGPERPVPTPITAPTPPRGPPSAA